MINENVSIVIPTWNRSDALIDCIRALINENISNENYIRLYFNSLEFIYFNKTI